jgi:protein tyrosine/serine phosphatase
MASSAHAEIPRFLNPAPGIYRGGQPENREDYRQLRALGVRTIINLRTGGDAAREREMVRDLDMEVIASPIQTLRGPREGQLDELLRLLADESLRPVFVHCAEGKDRTGLVVGLYRVTAEHWSKEDAYREMRVIGFNPAYFRLKQAFWKYGEAFAPPQ